MQPVVYQYLVGLFAALGAFTYGYDLGVMAEVISTPDAKRRYNFDSTVATYDATALGLVISLFTAGAFFGAFFAGYSGDFFGRRLTITGAAVIFNVGGILQATSSHVHQLQVGRFITGLGVGFFCMIVPVYQSELAHPAIRGRITAFVQFMLGVGALCANWIGYGCFHSPAIKDGPNAWRIPLGIQCVPAGILGLLIFLFPESPRWLIDHGKTEEGLQVLAKLHARGDVNDSFVRAEYEAIQDRVVYEHEHGSKSWLQLFENKSNTRRTILAVALQFSIQMTGVSCIQYYSTTIFNGMGISAGTTLLLQSINSIIGLVAQFTCVLFIDKFGRRWPLIIGNLINTLAFIIATIMLAENSTHKVGKGLQWLFILATWLYQFSFSSTCGPLSWIIPAEMFNTATRARGVSLATMASFAANTLIGQVSPIALAAVGYKYFYLFIVCNLTNALFFWSFLPETSKVPLEAMDALFTEAPLFVAGKTRKHRLFLEDLERRTQEIDEKNLNSVHVDG